MISILNILICLFFTSGSLTGRDPVGGAIGVVVAETAGKAMDQPGASPEERWKIALQT